MSDTTPAEAQIIFVVDEISLCITGNHLGESSSLERASSNAIARATDSFRFESLLS
jgi:hypothetical protein